MKRKGRKKKEKGGKRKKEVVEGPIRKKQKKEEGGCKNAGGGKTKLPGGTLGFGVRWAWAGLGNSLAILKFLFFFYKIILTNNFENGDDCLDKIFSGNFRKNKIGFIKNNFCCQNYAMR